MLNRRSLFFTQLGQVELLRESQATRQQTARDKRANFRG